jgi:predicted nucleic acid-binding protein
MSNVVVVDASIAIKWILYEPDSATAKALLAEWIDKETVILAPALLAFEITNSLYQKTRRGEISLDRARLALTKVLTTDLVLDSLQDSSLSIRALEFAHRFNLPATYDSHYLALAEREGCELWTADTRLWNSIKGKLTWVRLMSEYSTP